MRGEHLSRHVLGLAVLMLGALAVPAVPAAERTVQAVKKRSADRQSLQSRVAAKVSPQRLQRLNARIDKILQYYQQRPLNTRDHNAWEVMHHVVAFGVKTQVRVGGPQGPQQPAIGWLCFNYPFRGFRILVLHNGLPLGNKGYGVQGHHGQLLAILAQSRLRKDYPLRIGSQQFTVADLIENEKRTCRSGMELTFKLIGLSYYISTTETWQAEDGQRWSISRLLREEIAAPIHGVTCGGTHRLMGYAYAVWKRRKEGLPLDGQFYRAEKYLADYHRWAFKLQNPDGSFSSQWLRYRAHSADPQRRLRTTGHILEWLAFSLPQQELSRPEMVRAAEHIVGLLERNPDYPWEIGPLGHALHALAIYRRRVQAEEEISGPQSRPLVAPQPQEQKNAGKSSARKLPAAGAGAPEPKAEEILLPVQTRVQLRQTTQILLRRIHSQVAEPPKASSAVKVPRLPASSAAKRVPRQVHATGPVLVGPR